METHQRDPLDNTRDKSGQAKRLYRSKTNKVFAGVCGGLGEYANIDPVFIRLIWLLVIIFSGVVPGVVAYFFAIFIIPKRA